MVAHVLAHRELEHSLPSDTVTEWTAAVVAWEREPTKPNPFDYQVERMFFPGLGLLPALISFG